MKRLFDLGGTLTGLLGTLVCAAAVLARVAGQHFVYGSETRAWLLGGIALLVLGCFLKLHALTSDR